MTFVDLECLFLLLCGPVGVVLAGCRTEQEPTANGRHHLGRTTGYLLLTSWAAPDHAGAAQRAAGPFFKEIA